ncbi:MAG TPA: phosphopantetheine-binding protein [Kofleriaceae bacterium]|jgi:acyl carrier protein|nr:phosphopantetheine-binding protein [Kofleriaceae bacterium]
MKNDANDVLGFLKKLVLELTDTDEETITRQASFQDLQLDSLDFVEVQVQVKQTFGALIDPDSFVSGRIATLGQLVDLIASGGELAAAATAPSVQLMAAEA